MVLKKTVKFLRKLEFFQKITEQILFIKQKCPKILKQMLKIALKNVKRHTKDIRNTIFCRKYREKNYEIL